uniref:PsbP C-terminal domain-containing protein n=1 Tax=Coccolithus braarudii TaxID=221442 RepID=A0A7S0LKR7_9EUKA
MLPSSPPPLHPSGRTSAPAPAAHCLVGASLSRGLLLRALLLPPAALLPLPGLAAPTVGMVGFQADDKSFDFTLPDGWRLSPDSGRVHEASALFAASASSPQGAASAQVLVDLGKYGNNLDEFGPPQRALTKALGVRSQAPLASDLEILSSAKVSGRVRGSSYYLAHYRRGAARSGLVKIGVAQNRLFRMIVEAPTDSTQLQTQVEELIDSFQVFPINFICKGQSNAGSVPTAGSCY